MAHTRTGNCVRRPKHMDKSLSSDARQKRRRTQFSTAQKRTRDGRSPADKRLVKQKQRARMKALRDKQTPARRRAVNNAMKRQISVEVGRYVNCLLYPWRRERSDTVR